MMTCPHLTILFNTAHFLNNMELETEESTESELNSEETGQKTYRRKILFDGRSEF